MQNDTIVEIFIKFTVPKNTRKDPRKTQNQLFPYLETSKKTFFQKSLRAEKSRRLVKFAKHTDLKAFFKSDKDK